MIKVEEYQYIYSEYPWYRSALHCCSCCDGYIAEGLSGSRSSRTCMSGQAPPGSLAILVWFRFRITANSYDVMYYDIVCKRNLNLGKQCWFNITRGILYANCKQDLQCTHNMVCFKLLFWFEACWQQASNQISNLKVKNYFFKVLDISF